MLNLASKGEQVKGAGMGVNGRMVNWEPQQDSKWAAQKLYISVPIGERK